jgi:two-component system CheB/CheR fusion protein
VRAVAERETLQPGLVFVVPPDRDVEITDSEVRVREDDRSGPMPSVDRLLMSAARVYGETLIAVILTGSGSDGTVGAREVKNAGGTVVIQNPQTAAFPSMPRSLPPSVVDIVADVERIGPILNDLLTGAYLPVQPDEERTLQRFLEQLRERSGIDFAAYKLPTIRRRLQSRLVATDVGSLRDYLRYCQRYPEEYQRLVSSCLIK